ncbi:9768_t:CDS:2 [Diversispora eburnea]|uniref:9768_t:CDS:1 n=1 Tax=Diversispora eburnea TaxID=1213867 RepID=A0A9N8Z6Z4_9GLOM|nr:9768_t:CDS:2 [Diversispora eburnea]
MSLTYIVNGLKKKLMIKHLEILNESQVEHLERFYRADSINLGKHHPKNILVHEERLLITDLGLSQPLDSNSMSEICRKVTSGEREKSINETPKDYIIYSSAWKNDPNQRPKNSL